MHRQPSMLLAGFPEHIMLLRERSLRFKRLRTQDLKIVDMPTPREIEITIITLSGRRFPIHISNIETVEGLKERIQAREGTPPDQQRLVTRDATLIDSRCLYWYGLQDGAQIHLVLRLRGGMYHDSSARNGFSGICTIVVRQGDIYTPLTVRINMSVGEFLDMLTDRYGVYSKTPCVNDVPMCADGLGISIEECGIVSGAIITFED